MELKHNYIKPALPLLGCHVAGIVISFIFVVGMASLNGSIAGKIITAIVVLIVYSIPMYSNMWMLGNKDLNMQNCGKLKKDLTKGFKIGLITSIPMFILTILFVISKFGLFYNFTFTYKIINSHLTPIINIINNATFLSDFSVLDVFAISALSLIMPIFTGVFYIMGNKEITPIRKLMYKGKK